MYCATTQWGPLGEELFERLEVIAWDVVYRTYGNKQRLRYAGPSRFGALREVIRRCRQWYGASAYRLEVLRWEPVYKAHYVLVE